MFLHCNLAAGSCTVQGFVGSCREAAPICAIVEPHLFLGHYNVGSDQYSMHNIGFSFSFCRESISTNLLYRQFVLLLLFDVSLRVTVFPWDLHFIFFRPFLKGHKWPVFRLKRRVQKIIIKARFIYPIL